MTMGDAALFHSERAGSAGGELKTPSERDKGLYGDTLGDTSDLRV